MQPKTVYASPSRDGNGFLKTRIYKFTHHKNGLYVTDLMIGGRVGARYENEDTLLDGKKSAHLWDGLNWLKAGTWKVIKTDDTDK